MVDILERLQSQRTSLGTLWPEPNLHEEAAEKITQLREELAAVTERMSKLDFERTAAELERDALREENARLRAENRHTITKKIVLEWYPELDKQTGCYDYRVAMHSMGQAFDVFRQLVLYPALDENVLLREENARLREVLKPFVKTLELNCTEAYPDDFFIDQEGALRVSDLRAAAAAIREGEKNEN